MADKRIDDFATLEEAQDDDLLLVSSEDETYNIRIKALKKAITGNLDNLSTEEKGSLVLAINEVAREVPEYVVNMTKNADGTYTADKTFAELKAAHDAGRTVVCSFQDLTMQWHDPCRLPLVYLSDTAMGFSSVIEPEQGYVVIAWASINSSGMGYAATEISAKSDIGNLSSLSTTAKSNLVLAINEIFKSLEDHTNSTPLPIARGQGEDGIAYVAAGDDLPTVQPSSNGHHVGKGKQIIFIPDRAANKSGSPTLQINGSAAVQIRMRAPNNQGVYDTSPDATLPVPVGALMVGVPYTMTFCGMYWLIDSQITQYACAEDESQADLLKDFAGKLVALTEGDTIGVPIINSVDGVGAAKATIVRSGAEEENPDGSGNVTLPTVNRVKEMTEVCVVNMAKNADGTYTADKTFAELKAAHDAGKTVICSFQNLMEGWPAPFRLPLSSVSSDEMYFGAVSKPMQGYRDYASLVIDDLDRIIYLEPETANIPAPTAADKGKVLEATGTGAAEWKSTERTCTTLTRYGSAVTVHCHGLREDKTYKLCLYTASRHKGNKMGAWYHPANYDAAPETGASDHRIGYGKLAGKQIYGNPTPVFPGVPDWMPNGGYLQTEWELGADGTVTVPLNTWLLPMVKPAGLDAWTTEDLSTGTYVAGRMLGVSNKQLAGLLLRFCLVDGDGMAYPCEDTLTVGGGRWTDARGTVFPRVFVDDNSTYPTIRSRYLYTSIR